MSLVVHLATAIWGSLVLFAQTTPGTGFRDPTPLMPHPPNRPVYSQDRYKKDEDLPPPVEEKPPTWTQDKYDREDDRPDYSDELRKVPAKGREWSEIEIAKGIVELNGERFDESEKHFLAALTKDPRNFVAMEYLASLQERRGDLTGAIAWLAKAKHMALKGRWGAENFQIGRLYMLLKNYVRAEAYLRLALDEGGHLTATNYTLGYLYYLQERYFEAERYLHEAKMRAQRRSALTPEREMLQAINYYLGEIYARLGFVQYSVLTLRATEYGPSWEVRNAAWRVHSELNQFATYLQLGVFGQYDSNVVLLPTNQDLPTEFSTAGGYASVLSVTGGLRTTPARKWMAGLDGAFYLNTHANTTLAGFDVMNFNPVGWFAWWNLTDWMFTGRYELNHSLTDRHAFTTFQSSHGPTVAANYFPFQRWNWEFGFQYLVNSFAADLPTGPDRRSGHSFIGFFKASLRSPNPRFRPSFGYTFMADATDGQDFQSRNHIFLLEADYRLFQKTHLVTGITLSRVLFPNHLEGRADTVRQLRIGLNHLIDPHWVATVDATQVQDASTLENFSYNRLIVTSGLTYSF
jgi:tetratricopeptide (TPR) repeat protein